jgi:hypothetical protein
MQAAARCPKSVGDLDVVDAAPTPSSRWLSPKRLPPPLEDEAVAVVPVVKHPRQQATEGDRRIPSCGL